MSYSLPLRQRSYAHSHVSSATEDDSQAPSIGDPYQEDDLIPDYEDYSGRTPPFTSQRRENAWKEERERRERLKELNLEEDVVRDGPSRDTPGIEVDDQSTSQEVGNQEVIAQVKESEAGDEVKEELQEKVAVPKRKREISTDSIKNETEGKNADMPCKRQKKSRLVKVKVPPGARSVKVIVKFHEGNVE